ncbi:hypothetical protein N0V82_000617 [Gnomoniopsis sp. IMI 355080]|nr:hypothetical protein N0V82_000617 [Gnomoniopsis sp. IMI 355080]
MFGRRPRMNSGSRVPASPASPPLSIASTADLDKAGHPVKKAISHTRLFGRTFTRLSDSLSENSKRNFLKSSQDQPQDASSLASLTEDTTLSTEIPSTALPWQGNSGPSDAAHNSHGVDGVMVPPRIESLGLSRELPLPGLQARFLKDTKYYEPLKLADLGPDSFDLVPSDDHGDQGLAPSMLEHRFEVIFSDYHLDVILQDYSTLQRFTDFITSYRPKSLPLLNYYLSLMKAQAALYLTNSIIHDLKPVSYHGDNLEFTENSGERIESQELQDKIAKAFQPLARDDLSAYVTHQWMTVVEASMKQRVRGLLPSHLKE